MFIILTDESVDFCLNNNNKNTHNRKKRVTSANSLKKCRDNVVSVTFLFSIFCFSSDKQLVDERNVVSSTNASIRNKTIVKKGLLRVRSKVAYRVISFFERGMVVEEDITKQVTFSSSLSFSTRITTHTHSTQHTPLCSLCGRRVMTAATVTATLQEALTKAKEFLAQDVNNPEWKAVETKNEAKLWEREIGKSPVSPHPELRLGKAVITIEAPAKLIFDTIWNLDSQRQWDG
jgi:hypothetical protein